MKTASDIIDYIGPEALMARLGIGHDAIKLARKNGKIPALWYAAIREMALPDEVFSFKGDVK